MAFADDGTAPHKIIPYGPEIRVTAGEAWQSGDLVYFDGSDWLQADVDEDPEDLYIAAGPADVDDVDRPLVKSARIRGGRYSGGASGEALYLSDDGKVTTDEGLQRVGVVLSAEEVMLSV